jgi:hypothetical protein
LTGLAGVWAMMHVQLARLTDTPELAMAEADAKTLMVAAQNVMRHYSIAATQKAVDWMTFASVATFMYAPRAVAVRKRMRRRPGASSQSSPDVAGDPHTGPAQIFAFRPQPGPPQQAPQMGPVIDVPSGEGLH